MAQHIIEGHGSPIANSVAISAGAHYIDLDTGDQYLCDANGWSLAGGGGISWSSQGIDTSTVNPVPVDFSKTQLFLVNQPASGPIILDLSTIDPPSGTTPVGQVDILVNAIDVGVQLGNGSNLGALPVALEGGCTISGATVSPPTGGQLWLKLVTADTGNLPPQLFIRATAITNSTPSNF